MGKALYVLGAGGHCSVLVDILKTNGEKVEAVFTPEQNKNRQALSDVKILPNENVLLDQDPNSFLLINAIGSLPGNTLREKIFCKFTNIGYFFKQVISKQAIVSPYATLGHGVQIMTGAIVQAGAKIGDNSIINTGAIIEHDCIIGDHNHIAPGVTLSGEVVTGTNVHIGTGAVLIQGVSIGEHTVIAAGAIVTKDIGNEKIVFGAKANVQNKKVKS